MADLLTTEFESIMSTLRAAYKAAAGERILATIEKHAPNIVGKDAAKGKNNNMFYNDPWNNPMYPDRDILRSTFRVVDVDGETAANWFVSVKWEKQTPDVIAAYVAKESEYSAAMAFDGFVRKNVSKMEGILKDHKVAAVNHSIHGIQGEMFVKCEDGAKFRMSFKVEYATSKNNVFFARFPTRFHDVVKTDGTKIASASEAKMKKEF